MEYVDDEFLDSRKKERPEINITEDLNCKSLGSGGDSSNSSDKSGGDNTKILTLSYDKYIKCISDRGNHQNTDNSKTDICKEIREAIISNIHKYIEQFERKNNEILIDFCKYLISDEFFEIIKKEHNIYKNKNYKFKTLFEMVETLL
jgi:hypothetical protein